MLMDHSYKVDLPLHERIFVIQYDITLKRLLNKSFSNCGSRPTSKVVSQFLVGRGSFLNYIDSKKCIHYDIPIILYIHYNL